MRFVQRHPMLARQLVRYRTRRRVPNPRDLGTDRTLWSVFCI
jgi:hypothetical protein